MIPFNLGKYSFELPQDYGELTLKQFFELRKFEGDLIGMISVLSGLDRTLWEQARDINIDLTLSVYLDWLNKPFNPEDYILPDRLQINGVYYNRPKDLKSKTLAQKISLQNEMERVQKENGTDVDLIPFALALYFHPIVTGEKYDSEKVEAFIPEIMNCKVEEAYPIASFFLLNWAKSLSKNESDFRILQARKKYERELSASKSSKSLGQFTLLRRTLIKVLRKSYKWITQPYSSSSGTKRRRQAFRVN